MARAAVGGILMAQIATWALWPRKPMQQLPALEAKIASKHRAPVERQWSAILG